MTVWHKILASLSFFPAESFLAFLYTSPPRVASVAAFWVAIFQEINAGFINEIVLLLSRHDYTTGTSLRTIRFRTLQRMRRARVGPHMMGRDQILLVRPDHFRSPDRAVTSSLHCTSIVFLVPIAIRSQIDCNLTQESRRNSCALYI